MKSELTRPIRRTTILFWVMAALFVAQMAWWIAFQLWHGREDLIYRERALRSEPYVALHQWRQHIQKWTDSLRTAWSTVDTITPQSLSLDLLQGWNEVYFEGPGGCRLIGRNAEATTPLGRIDVPVAGGRIAVSVDASALQQLLARESPHLLLGPRADSTNYALAAVEISQLSLDPRALESVLEDRRSRFRMFIGEGAFFLVLILAGAVAIHRALRRGVEFERQQQNFLAAVTHELKAPLASIRLFADTLSTRQLSDQKQRECLDKITRDVERLEELIDDALDAGVFSRRSFHPTLEENDLSEQLESYVEIYRERAERAGLSITADIASEVRARIDQVHLRRAIGAVIENAIRYSRPETGGTDIQISLRMSENEAIVTIADQGVGLHPEDQKRVFERFYRAGDEMTRRVRGSGLGLYLARGIILAHGGRIKLWSDGPGTGTTVQIHLPLVRSSYSA